MKNYYALGELQIVILQALKEEQWERRDIYDQIRHRYYKANYNKNLSRVAIRRAIKSLKQRKLIYEKCGILSLNN